MNATVIANGQTVVHRGSGGVVTTTDICNTPMGNAVVPIPYTNVARSQDVAGGSQTVFMDGNPIMLKDSVFSRSSGDEAGTLGGVSSGVTGGKARFVNYSNNVFVEGRPVCRRLDPMVSNISGSANTPPAALMQPNIAVEETEATGHVISFSVVFVEPDVATGQTLAPGLTNGYVLRGPEELRREKGTDSGAPCRCRMPGEFTLLYDPFALTRQPLNRQEEP